MSWSGVVTNAGTNLFAQYALGGMTLSVAGAKLGKAVSSESDKHNVTQMADYVCDGSIVSQSSTSGGITYRIEATPQESSYALHEMGLYVTATSGGSSSDVLVAYMWENDGIQIPSAASFPDFVYVLAANLVNISADIEFTVDTAASVPFSHIYNGLDKTEEGYALDARQGKALKDEVNIFESGMAIYIEGDEAPETITVGKYLLIRGNSTLPDGIYCSTGVIASGGSVTSSKVREVTGGVINDLDSAIAGKLVKKAKVITLTGSTWSSIWDAISGLSKNECGVFYSMNNATYILSGQARSGVLYGTIARIDTDKFILVVCAGDTGSHMLIIRMTNVSSSSAGTYSEFDIVSAISGKVDTSKVYNGLDKSASGFVLDARQGKALNDAKLEKTSVYNGLDKAEEGYALDARQGKALSDAKLDKTSVYNGLDKTAEGFALDARQGAALNNSKASLYNLSEISGTSGSDWQVLWGVLNGIAVGKVAAISLSGQALSMMSAVSYDPGTPPFSGTVTKTEQSGSGAKFSFIVADKEGIVRSVVFSSTNGVQPDGMTNSSYAENVYDLSKIQHQAIHTTSTGGIVTNLNSVKIGEWGRATFSKDYSGVSPISGSNTTGNYICFGQSDAYKTIILFAQTTAYYNTCYSNTWQGWKTFTAT